MTGARAIVVGAGVAGLCTALELRRAGAECRLFDPAPLGANASGVAAGMLAPAFESVLDSAARGRFGLLRAGRDLWLDMGVEVRRDGALWLGPDAETIAAALRAEGAAAELRLHEGRPAVFTPDDWRLEPVQALEHLRRAYLDLGGVIEAAAVQAVRADGARVQDAWLGAEAVVVCAGFGSVGLSEGASELAVLTPVRGELVRFPGAEPRSGPTLRHAGGYIVPSAAGPLAGATMEPGAIDLRPSAAAAREASAAEAVLPALAGAPFEAAVGVRAAAPDGLPLVGRSRSGVWLAAGFRRNGWTLAPLAARIVAASVAGADPGPWAGILRPDRF